MFEWGVFAAKLATLANNAFSYFTKKEDQNTGRKLQTADDLAASISGDTNAQKTREDVAGLDDGQLNDELRSGPAGADRR